MDETDYTSFGGKAKVLVAARAIVQDCDIMDFTLKPIGKTFETHSVEDNFTFRVDVRNRIKLQNAMPGTSPASLDGEKHLVLRIANPQTLKLSHKNRIESTVASMSLAHNDMGHMFSPEEKHLALVVPKVYKWRASVQGDTSDPKTWGWILCEFKEGENLASIFPTLSFKDKINVMQQIAVILYGLQQVRLPKNLDRFGGFDFNDNGDIINAGMFHLKGRAWDLYSNVWTAKVRCVIEDDFKARGLVKDWKEDGLVKFMKDFLLLSGLTRALNGVDSSKMGLVHGDLTMDNMLYDTKSKSITALLDFDWATITNPADEFLTGLGEVGGGFVDKPPELLACLFRGEFSIILENPTHDDLEKWELARTWHEIATQRGVMTPSCIKGVDKIERLHKMLKELYIPKLTDEDKMKLSPISPAVVEAKEEVNKRMQALIGCYGYGRSQA